MYPLRQIAYLIKLLVLVEISLEPIKRDLVLVVEYFYSSGQGAKGSSCSIHWGPFCGDEVA